jgi:hypothetical protein
MAAVEYLIIGGADMRVRPPRLLFARMEPRASFLSFPPSQSILICVTP